MRTSITMSFAALLLGAVACQQPAPTPSAETPSPKAASPEALSPEALSPEALSPAKVSDSKPASATGDDVMDGCPGGEDGGDHAACGQAAQASASDGHFGQPFALQSREGLSAATTRLASAKAGETVQVTGTVDAVCKKKGCWMVIKDGDVTARVFTHAGKFFMPVGTNKGRKAVVEGELKARTMSEKFAKHLAEDKGEDPSSVSGPSQEWVLNATSAELL
jgi:Domain of unknown function (DUF4920)